MQKTRTRIGEKTLATIGPDDLIMDTFEAGFGVRRQKGGSITFFVRSSIKGGPRKFISIGTWGVGGMTLTRARDEAKQLIAAMRRGEDPTRASAARAALPTVAELCRSYIDANAVRWKPPTLTMYRDALRLRIAPTIGKIRCDELRRAEVLEAHTGPWATSTTAANRALSLLCAAYNFACNDLEIITTNPAGRIKKHKEQSRERYLTLEEFGRIGEALRTLEAQGANPYALAAIKFALLTGMRRGEILDLQWRQVDFERGAVAFDDSKTGRKTVQISTEAVELLKQDVPRVRGVPYAFPSPSMKPFTSLKHIWRNVVEIAGLEGMRMHDTRHSFASAAAAGGASLPEIGKLLGHSQTQTTARYSHLADDHVRSVANNASARIASAMKR